MCLTFSMQFNGTQPNLSQYRKHTIIENPKEQVSRLGGWSGGGRGELVPKNTMFNKKSSL